MNEFRGIKQLPNLAKTTFAQTRVTTITIRITGSTIGTASRQTAFTTDPNTRSSDNRITATTKETKATANSSKETDITIASTGRARRNNRAYIVGIHIFNLIIISHFYRSGENLLKTTDGMVNNLCQGLGWWSPASTILHAWVTFFCQRTRFRRTKKEPAICWCVWIESTH